MKSLFSIPALGLLCPLGLQAQPFVRPDPVRFSKSATSSNYVVEFTAVTNVSYYLMLKTNNSSPHWFSTTWPFASATNGRFRYEVAPPRRPFGMIRVYAIPSVDGTGNPIGPLSPTNLLVYPIDSTGTVTATNTPAGTNAPPGDPGNTNAPPDDPPTRSPLSFTMSGSIASITSDRAYGGSFGTLIEEIESDPPFYTSTRVENKHFEGVYYVTNDSLALYVHSDDGARVTVNGRVEYDTYGLGQNWDNHTNSFSFVCCLSPGTSNWVEVEYSNTIHGSGDRDGITLIVVGDDPTHPRVLGDTQLDWYKNDGSDEFIYTLNAHADPRTLVWVTSPNLKIESTNEPLQRITVVATGGSARPGSDWVEARWSPRCGGVARTNRLNVTVRVPTSVQQTMAPRRTYTTAFIAVVYTYRILDQFGSPFPFSCYVSEQTYQGQGTPPPGTIIDPPTQNLWVTGVFEQRVRFTRSSAFSRIHVLHAHRQKDGFGAVIGIFDVIFTGEDILIVPRQPGS